MTSAESLPPEVILDPLPCFSQLSAPGTQLMLEFGKRQGGHLHPRGPEVGRVSASQDCKHTMHFSPPSEALGMVYK